jgi:DNA-binding LytR/AlgR family response regulator
MKEWPEQLKWSLLFALLQVFGNAFLDGQQFLNPELSPLIYYLALFSLVFILTFLLLTFSKSRVSGKQALLFRIITFPLVAVLSAVILFITFRSADADIAVYAVSFLLLSLPGAIWSLLQSLFDEADERITQMVKARMASNPNEDNNVKEVLFHLENENGKLLLEVPVSRIICYEANDNYVLTHYLDRDGVLKRSMERISLRKIEQLLAEEQIQFLRVHKSYLVNPEYVSNVKGRSQAYKLQLRDFDQLVPVSRSYDVSAFGLK